MKNPKDTKAEKKCCNDYKGKYLRALADYQNLEKRVEESKKIFIQKANESLLLKIIPFLDDLERAEIFIKDPNLKLVKENLMKILKDEGVEKIEVLGKGFDPFLCEAVEMVPGEKENIVVEVVRKGYKFKGEVLRVARVKVSKKL